MRGRGNGLRLVSMSRIGSAPITIPDGVNASVEGQKIMVTGPRGELRLIVRGGAKVEVAGNEVVVKSKKQSKSARSMHGLMRALIANMVRGVDKGWEKKLELVGVGFRAQSGGDRLSLNVGYSHPVEIVAPEGISFQVDENTKITVLGRDKNMVGQVAANIRKVRPPEPYKGKGIRYVGEYIKRKAGKAGKVGVGIK